MWSAAVRVVGIGCARVLGGRSAACVILVRKQRINTFAARLYGRNSALKILLGVSKAQPSTEECLAPQVPGVSFNKADQDSLLKNCPDQPENPKLLKIAIIGAPNAGKSTLSNQLLGRKLFPVSCKVHTTRCLAQGVVTEGDKQLILLDTPGMVTAVKAKRHNLENSLKQDPWESVKMADVVLVLVDVSEKMMRHSLHSEVLKCLSHYPEVPSILVLNKVDMLKDKSTLLQVIETLTEGVVGGKKAVVQRPNKTVKGLSVKVDETNQISTEQSEGSTILDPSSDIPADVPVKRKSALNKQQKTGWAHFQEIFMLSALNGDEVNTLKKYLMTLVKPGEWLFHSDVVTTQSPQEICDNIIREKLLEHLPKELPYGVTQVTTLWEEGSSGELHIVQSLLVTKGSHAGRIIGSNGTVIDKITREAAQDLMNAFLCDVRLRLTVKHKK